MAGFASRDVCMCVVNGRVFPPSPCSSFVLALLDCACSLCSPQGPNRKLILIDMKPKMLRWPFGVSDDQMGKPPWMELRTVYVSKNKLKGLPYDFFKLTNLTDLRLDNNLMTNLAVTVSQLTNLRTLWLHNNLLETLPIEVSVLQGLRYVMLFQHFPGNSFSCNRLLRCSMES